MSEGRQPPALLVKTLGVTFGMVALLLVIVFIVVLRDAAHAGAHVRHRQSRIEPDSLRGARGAPAARAARPGRDASPRAPTLKAALDT